MGIWKLPESARLETEVIDKLAQAPWRLLGRPSSLVPRPSSLLRPLLNDLVQEESFLEIREATNQPGELAFAIRLDDTQAAVWQTNLALVLDSLTGIQPESDTNEPYVWMLKKHHVPDLIELARTNGWTLVGAAQDHNGLMDELLARLHNESAPFAAGTTNYWLEASLDLKRIGNALGLGWQLPENWPSLAFTAIGDGTNVWTRGELDFPKPIPLDFAAWKIPTNLIHAPVTSFCAIRGLAPWLASWPVWSNLHIGPPPSQFYSWAEKGFPTRTSFAARFPDASNVVRRISEDVFRESRARFGPNDPVSFGLEMAPGSNGLNWKGLPYLWPTLKFVTSRQTGFALLSLFPSSAPASWPPPKLPEEVFGLTNLISYDWEITGARVDDWLYIAQFFREVTHTTQLPFKAPSVLWLRAAAKHLGESVSHVTAASPKRISFVRKSTIGFTGFELQLLADWLESPTFPVGWCTFQGVPRLSSGGATPAAAKPQK